MKRIIIILILGFTISGLHAQQRLTLDECRRLALEQSEEMKIARLTVEKAEAERAAMKTQYFPSLSANATGVYLHNKIKQELTLPTVVPDMTTGELQPNVMVNPMTGEVIMGPDGNPVFNMYAWLPLEISLKGAYMAGIALQQPLFTGGKIAAGNSMTKIGVEMAADNLDLQRSQIIYETDQAWWLYVSVLEKVKLAESYEELLSRLEERVNNAWETGMTTRNEFLKVAVKHNEAKLQLQKARSGLELTRMALCRITGLPFDTKIVTPELSPAGDGSDHSGQGLTSGGEGVTVTGNENSDVTARPEYRLLEKNVLLAGEEVKLARADFLPTVGVSVGYNFVGGIEIGPEAFDTSSPSVIASVTIPLFHWGEGRQKQLSARRAQEIKRMELEKNSRLMSLEIEQARLNLSDARLRVEMAAASLAQTAENLRISSDNFEVGMGLLTDLLEAQAQWQSARSELIDAGADLRLRETAWLKAVGALR